MYFKKKMEGESNLCLTGITTHEIYPVYVCVCALGFPYPTPPLQKRQLSFCTKLRVIIKTIKSKISKKILNRLQIAKMQNIIKQIQRGFNRNFFCVNYMYRVNREPVIKRDHFVLFLAETHYHAICHNKYLSETQYVNNLITFLSVNYLHLNFPSTMKKVI